MPQSSIRFSLIATLIATAACTQEPAQVDLRGQNLYTRDSYAMGNLAPAAGKPANAPYYSTSAPQPVSYQTSSTASSVSVSDLPAPSKASATPAPKPQPQASNTNPWTGKPHFSDTSTAQNAAPEPKPQAAAAETHVTAPSQEKSIARLDRSSHDSGKNTQTSFMWPVNAHKIISGFGPKGGGKANDGINIASAEGEPVWAAADGEIIYAGNDLPGYGNMIIIKHANKKSTTYAHLNRYTVDKYDRVKQGDIIGYVGSTGNVTEPQLHFAIRDGKDPVDPAKFLNRSVASN